MMNIRFGHSESVRNPYGLETWEQRSLKAIVCMGNYRYTLDCWEKLLWS